MYFLTIKSGEDILCNRVPFADYADAIAACGDYYDPRTAGATLNFTSVVVAKKFLRSYASLTRLEDLRDTPRGSPQAIAAVKQDNAFVFKNSYVFLIESDEGVREAQRREREDDE